MLKTLTNSKIFFLFLGYYIYLLIWWIYINSLGLRETYQNHLFGLMFSLLALSGSLYGLYVSKTWGGIHSLIGRAIIYFSIGLLGQFFGQATWSYYNIVAQIEIPYPSVADIGYFSIIPFYALGMINLARAANAKKGLKKLSGKIVAMLVPAAMVIFCYFIFLRDVELDFSDPIRLFLDFGYPLGEAITISIALVTYGLSNKILGGQMRSRIFLLIIALLAQFITDFTFLYLVGIEQYYNAGIVDLMYTTSIFIMAIGLITMREIPDS